MQQIPVQIIADLETGKIIVDLPNMGEVCVSEFHKITEYLKEVSDVQAIENVKDKRGKQENQVINKQ